MTAQRSEEQMIAYALEAEPALLPYLPALLADLDELGSDAEQICDVIAGLRLPQTATVLDLGCGKGTVAIEVASELGISVTGIELFKPFVDACENAAERSGVAHLCRFIHGDILKLSAKTEPADVVVLAALGDVLGRLDKTVEVVRQFAKPGGYIVISDAYVREGGSTDYPGFEQYAGRDQTVAWLQSSGDRVLDEVLGAPDDEDDATDEGELILARAKELARRHPEAELALLDFARTQMAENQYIDDNLIDVVWLLRRANGSATV